MNTNRKTAISVGVLFIGTIVTWVLGSSVIESIISVADYLITVSANEPQVIRGVLFELINVAAVVGIAVLLFPILKQQNESIALGYVGFRIIEAIVLVVSVISLLSLLTLSQEYVKAGAPDASYFQTLGTFAVAGRYWSGQMAAIFGGLGGLMLGYLLYQSKLIPRFISVLGLIGYAALLTGALLDMFGYSTGMVVFIPGVLFEILLAVWLIVKGFNPSAIASLSAKTDINEIK